MLNSVRLRVTEFWVLQQRSSAGAEGSWSLPLRAVTIRVLSDRKSLLLPPFVPIINTIAAVASR